MAPHGVRTAERAADRDPFGLFVAIFIREKLSCLVDRAMPGISTWPNGGTCPNGQVPVYATLCHVRRRAHAIAAPQVHDAAFDA
jgi:hypothetical protein